MQLETQIADFMAGETFAVAGASSNREKYGNKVLRCYLQKGHTAIPVNPSADEVEGIPAATSLSDIDPKPHGLSIITPPPVTEKVVAEAIELGIKHIWMQPGAESDAAVAACRDAGVNLISGGPCLLVVLGFRDV